MGRQKSHSTSAFECFTKFSSRSKARSRDQSWHLVKAPCGHWHQSQSHGCIKHKHLGLQRDFVLLCQLWAQRYPKEQTKRTQPGIDIPWGTRGYPIAQARTDYIADDMQELAWGADWSRRKRIEILPSNFHSWLLRRFNKLLWLS